MANVTQALPAQQRHPPGCGRIGEFWPQSPRWLSFYCCRHRQRLPVAGHRMLAILAFAVIVWMTEAIDYAVSAIVIAALMASCGLLAEVANPKVLMGTSAALSLAFSGFTNTGARSRRVGALSRGAMTATGLDRRIALTILSAGRHEHPQRRRRKIWSAS